MSVSRLSLDLPNAIEGQDAFEALSRREWLTVNGTGSYASGTVSGANTRSYHGHLVAMLPPPFGRMTLLSKVEERIDDGIETHDLSANRYPNNTIHPRGFRYLTKFAPYPAPTWIYRLPGGATFVKTLYLARDKNTAYLHYSLSQAAGPHTLEILPLVVWKPYHTEMHPYPGFPMRSEPLTDGSGWQFQAVWNAPRLLMTVETLQKEPHTWENAGWWHDNVVHERERERGFRFHEDLFCPAVARVVMQPGQSLYFAATIEPERAPSGIVAYRDTLRHLSSVLKTAKLDEDEAPLAQRSLALSADQFLVKTPDQRHTLLAGYPWFTDWGRDTMIALPGLCLTTGRNKIAREILKDFAATVSEGMIPNRFPDANETPEYNTVDATLWFIHACDQYAKAARDRAFREELLPVLTGIIAAHQQGTRYGIKMDPSDCLLSAGEPNSNLTWMDAKVAGNAITPRIGKPVEINALWINALHIAAEWSPKQTGKAYRETALQAGISFAERFVRPDGQGLYDVLGPDGKPDAAIRPNQVIAAALPRTPLNADELRSVLDVATRELLTPYGLRSLAPSDPAYRGRYQGGPNERDSAYHQGTVWPWLLGPYIDLYRKVNGLSADITALVDPLLAHMAEFGIGGIAEVFDGDAPHNPNGCPWQAWSTAEILRALNTVSAPEPVE